MSHLNDVYDRSARHDEAARRRHPDCRDPDHPGCPDCQSSPDNKQDDAPPVRPRRTMTAEQQAHIDLVNRLVQIGDVITHTRCMGLLEEHVVTGREGEWICGNATHDSRWMQRHRPTAGHGTTGWTNDISPLNVTHINRVPVECVELLARRAA